MQSLWKRERQGDKKVGRTKRMEGGRKVKEKGEDKQNQENKWYKDKHHECILTLNYFVIFYTLVNIGVWL